MTSLPNYFAKYDSIERQNKYVCVYTLKLEKFTKFSSSIKRQQTYRDIYGGNEGERKKV